MISTGMNAKRQALHYLAVDPFDCDTVHLYERFRSETRMAYKGSIRVEDLGDMFGSVGDDLRRQIEQDDKPFREPVQVGLALAIVPAGKAVR